ncbi:MAG: peptidase S41 [Candidatus Wallbacteria bacterium HGW-Wallbacteria-1]|jgi:carboxyl-terminal processing protease|uniref:Peptidase S41 n=1 Tax=Candidatus Wallbacteria bacterium HGW-Wallbacteria-1 TaxID=2013854 RepID=A0A2N1PU68_9BACT|nr:MAG: peptidase S41 [Candidatus Wallbacteria bacterium HGW-Wallbacteria-1]
MISSYIGIESGNRTNVIFLLLLAFLVSVMVGPVFSGRLPINDYRSLEPLRKVMTIIQKDYVDSQASDTRELVFGAIRGMLKTLDDPYTRFLDPETYREMKIETNGAFGGLGIVIGVRDGQLTIISPISGTPADRAGIRPGDRIVAVEGENLKDVSLQDAIKLLKGPEGTTISFQVAREGKRDPIPFTLTREVIKIQSVAHEMAPNKVGYLRISQFIETTASDVEKSLEQLVTAGAKAIVLDLRNNPGGLLEAAVRVSELFLSSGTVVSVQARDGRKVEYTSSGTRFPSLPMMVMVNRGSASASEIVAGALRDNGRAMLAGEKTYGKGCVQSVIPIDDEAAVAITTAWYFTPAGDCIHDRGILPDLTLLDDQVLAESTANEKEQISGQPGGLKDETGSGRRLNGPVGGAKAGTAAGAIADSADKDSAAHSIISRSDISLQRVLEMMNAHLLLSSSEKTGRRKFAEAPASNRDESR